MSKIYKYILRNDKTFKYECAYDSYIESCIKEEQEKYEKELEYAESEDEVWYFGGYYEPLNGVFVFKVIEYRPDGIGKTPTGNEWHVIAEGEELPNDVLSWNDNIPVAQKIFTSNNAEIGFEIQY